MKTRLLLVILAVMIGCGPKQGPAPDPAVQVAVSAAVKRSAAHERKVERALKTSGMVKCADGAWREECPEALQKPGRVVSRATVADPPGCVRHTPHASLWERVQILEYGLMSKNTMVVRNRDSCACPVQCFRATTGLHTAPSPWATCSLSYLGRWFKFEKPSAFCLAPGEEWRSEIYTQLADWSVDRCMLWTAHDVRRAEWNGLDRTLDYMECEGDCYGGPATLPKECAALVYPRAPEH